MTFRAERSKNSLERVSWQSVNSITYIMVLMGVRTKTVR